MVRDDQGPDNMMSDFSVHDEDGIGDTEPEQNIIDDLNKTDENNGTSLVASHRAANTYATHQRLLSSPPNKQIN